VVGVIVTTLSFSKLAFEISPVYGNFHRTLATNPFKGNMEFRAIFESLKIIAAQNFFDSATTKETFPFPGIE
jgi:hypothetical protein